MSEPERPSNLPQGKGSRRGEGARERLYLRRQELLREMQSTEDMRPINVREQVEVLKSGRSKGVDEEDWGAKERRHRGAPWMLWMILGLAIPLVLVLLILFSGRKEQSVGRSGAESGLDFNVLRGAEKVEPEDWFVNNSGPAFTEGIDILERLSKQGFTLEEAESLVRSPEQAKRLVAWDKAGKWSGFDTREPSNITWLYGSTGDIGYMTLMGVRKDFRDFRAYFVRDAEKLRLDVEATEAYCEVPIDELTGRTLQAPVLIRCWLAKEPHFDARSDENLFSWYQILDEDQVNFVWAYCKSRGPLDEALRKELNYGRVVVDRKKVFRATIRISDARGFRDDEFLIDELVASEWVLPVLE